MKIRLDLLLLKALCIGICSELARSAPLSLIENQNEEDSFVGYYVQRMKTFMNTSVDPCDDFYSYACGNYPNLIMNLETSAKRSSLYDLAFALNDEVDDILKTVRDPSEEYYDEMQIAKKFVDTCVNADLFPMKPSKEYLEVIKMIGGFPAIDATWNQYSFDWFNMSAHLTRYGIVGFVEETILLVYPFRPFYKLPKLGFGFDVYLENIMTKESDGYVHNEMIMRNLLEVYNVTGSKADEVTEEIFELWREILEIQAPLIGQDVVRSECIRLTSTHNSKSYFDKWKNIFDIVWGEPADRFTFESYCPCHYFYNQLDSLAERKPKVFANYMALKFLFSMHPKLQSTKFQRRHCVANVKAAMPVIFTHFFVKEHYDMEEEADVINIINELRASWKHRLNTANWLDDSAHDEALNKITNLNWRIRRVMDPISNVYVKLINSLNATDNVALNNLQLAKFKVDMLHYGNQHQWNNIKTEPYSILDGVLVRAFYLVLENTINVMSGLLHSPMYHKHFPNSLKYGRLGYVIGHEIGHAFEGIGFKYNSNLKRIPWLSKKSEAIAIERSNCFINDYDNYKEPSFGHKFSGKNSVSEIIADSTGLRQAFEAYRNVLKYGVKREGQEFLRKENIPALNMSPEQTFFLGFAQFYCSSYEPKNYWNEIYAKHPVARYRVIGTLRNYDEFSKVFQCPSDRPMNPSKKCQLW